MDQESLRIILKAYSKGGFNEDEAVQLIEDLYKYRVNYIPYWLQTTYGGNQLLQKFETTCKHD